MFPINIIAHFTGDFKPSIFSRRVISAVLYIYAAAFRDREAQALGAVADILTAGRDKAKKNA